MDNLGTSDGLPALIDAELMRFVAHNQPCSPWAVMRHSRYPYVETLRAIHRWIELGWVALADGQMVLNKRVDQGPIVKLDVCPVCDDRLVGMRKWPDEVFQRWADLTADRPPVDRTFAQWHVTTRSVLGRAGLIVKRALSVPRRVFILGDDDLTSVAISIVDPSAMVVVLDADARVVDFLIMLAGRHNLQISADLYDARNPLPEIYRNRFDAFFCDPTPTPECLTLFLSRCVDALQKGKSCRGYIDFYVNNDTFVPAQDQDPTYQRIFTEMGLVVSMALPSFTEYELRSEELPDELRPLASALSGMQPVAFNETFIELTTTAVTKSLVTGESALSLPHLLGFTTESE